MAKTIFECQYPGCGATHTSHIKPAGWTDMCAWLGNSQTYHIKHTMVVMACPQHCTEVMRAAYLSLIDKAFPLR